VLVAVHAGLLEASQYAKKPIKEAYALTPEQVSRIVAALENEPLQYQVMVMLYLQTGIRRSELVGLT